MSDAPERWRRATRALQTARNLVSEDPEAAVSRAYYAAFYAVSAYFALEGRYFNRHQGIEQAVHRDLVKAQLVPVEVGAEYSALFGLRSLADYDSGYSITADQANSAVASARRVVEAVLNLRPELASATAGGDTVDPG
jgi:uncharacterized protein (UPF0332 family)